MAHHWRCTLLLLGILFGLGIEASSWHMDDFIKALKDLENSNPDVKPVHLLRALRSASGLTDPFTQHYLGKPKSTSSLHSNVSQYLISALHYHIAPNNQELGVVLTKDGTTVALRPLLLGIEAGFLRRLRWDVPSRLLGTPATKKSPHFEDLGPDGCWDNIASPQLFTLAHRPSLLTTAQVNGGMDGVILAREAYKSRSLKLSALLTLYYSHQLDQRGLDAAPRIISQRRRENFKQLPSHRPALHVGRRAVQGTPTNLTLPLKFLFIHHTSTPSKPCVTFEQCSADMRAMQRFHQDDRGWDDIGYRLVLAGSSHSGHNSVGYGVSFIGDYSRTLPSAHSMELVRNKFASCAVRDSRLVDNYILQGHRQVVSTACPGDALFHEIQTWEHFGVTN
ncbi:hypothetical protein WMY93_003484 [Mugilogobius chulae]|uniref:Peptidoglycan recognition protein family domain-containing protein n=1 Tax=Mugilogobius chulae TaxID=88201 RepID=A0AAW0PWB1_9GOBI